MLTDTQFLRLRKAFTNNLLANIKLSKTKLSKMVQLGGFLPRGFSVLKNPKKLAIAMEKNTDIIVLLWT